MLDINDDKNWVSGNFIKSPNVKELLEQRAKTSQTMNDFNLSNTNLSDINLVNGGSSSGYTFTNMNLYKTNFTNAHCFKIDLSGSSLMKANFTNANLHCANLTNCNLLGTKFINAKLENVIWDKQIIQEREAEKSNILEEKIDLYQQAEEIYRNLRKTTESDGLFETAGYFFQKEMQMRRKKMPKFSSRRLISKVVDVSCGYGERPTRIISISIFSIFLFACIFFMTGLQGANNILFFSTSNNLNENINIFLDCLYFSVVTFTTLGYGDILPLGISKLFAGLEALLGGFVLAIFVVVFVKKMTR